jgi:hypothetical protein
MQQIAKGQELKRCKLSLSMCARDEQITGGFQRRVRGGQVHEVKAIGWKGLRVLQKLKAP